MIRICPQRLDLIPYVVMRMHGGTARLALLIGSQRNTTDCDVLLATNKLYFNPYSIPLKHVCSSPAVFDPDHSRAVQEWAAPACDSQAYWRFSTHPILVVQLSSLVDPCLDHHACNHLDRKCSQQLPIGRRRCRTSTHARLALYWAVVLNHEWRQPSWHAAP